MSVEKNSEVEMSTVAVDVKELQRWALSLSQGQAMEVRWEVEAMLKRHGFSTRADD